MSTEEVDVTPVSAAHQEGLAALFAADASPCYCRYWHFAGDKNAWLERCATAPEANLAGFRGALARGDDEARGVVALAAGSRELVGWAKVAPVSAVAKLYDQRLYRGLPVLGGDRARVFALGCMLVHPAWRRRGVASALVRGAVSAARSWGARALEAFPRRVSSGAHDADLWMGPLDAFLAEGFEVIHDFAPYPVLRRTL